MTQAYLKYFFALLLFGMNGIIASYIPLDSYEIVFMRTLTGSVFLIAVFLLSKKKLTCFQNKRHFLFLIISGMAMGASWIFLYEAYAQIGVSLATLAYYCGPVIVMALSTVLFGERMSVWKILGFSIVIAGMFLVNGNALFENSVSQGLLCGIFSAVMYAFMVIFNKKAENITGLENTMLQLVASFLTVAVFVLAKQELSVSAIMQNIVPILLLGAVNTGLGCYLYFSSIQQLSAGSVAICGYLEPLSALIFSAVFLQERLAAVQILGAAFIIGGAVLGEVSLLKFRSKAKNTNILSN